jgi:NAD(P)-dependent dehydrogenase (short-subunit alcohol dehydrogenase family)
MPADAGPADPPHELRFTPGDIERFAAASGDRNPLHVDRDFARRTPFGECIVHGALVAIGMLGALPPDELARVRALRAWFAGPVIPGATVRVTANPSPKAPGTWEIRLIGRGKPLARLVAGPGGERIAPGLADAALAVALQGGGTPIRTEPAVFGPETLETGRTVVADYRADEGLATLAAQFGAEALDRALLDGLAWASYVVGMELPGLNSLFSGLRLAKIEAGPSATRAERYRIELSEHDPRTGQLEVQGVLADGAGAPLVAAKIECFVRAPTGAPDLAALGLTGGARPRTGAAADLGTAVVIGASRGFGAALSLALVGRGYQVRGAHSSSGSAAALAELGGPRLHLHQLDAGDPEALAGLVAAIGEEEIAGLALNAALPPLPMGISAESARDLADYVAASVLLASAPLGALLSRVRRDGGWVMFTSSSALAAPPRDWPHYVTAKAALEGLARWVAETSPSLRTVILRPPAMRTEMTNTPSGRIAPVPTETIASWMADRLAGGELPAGLSTLEPGTVPPR